MGFVREEKELGKKFEVVDYLNLIGARTITGKPFLNVLDNVIVDRENNYFLVSRGGGLDVPRGYALCLDGNVLNLEVDLICKGTILNNSREVNWIIKRIEFPQGWSFDHINRKELSQIIIEAFTVESYHGPANPDNTKCIVNIEAQF